MGKKTISVNHIGFRFEGEKQLVLFEFEGQELYFKLPRDLDTSGVAEGIVCALLLPAMQRNADIEVSGKYTVSEDFISNIGQLQDVYVAWYQGLNRIDIHAARRRNEGTTVQMNRTESAVAAFFSGGVDASYTLLKRRDMITDLIYVRGIDMQLDDDRLWESCVSRIQTIANAYGKNLVAIETNVRFFIRALTEPVLGWYTSQGCGLSSIAHMAGFNRVFISSSNTYLHLHPLGSHPLTDRLFSSDLVHIFHDGCETSRFQKLLYLKDDQLVLDNLRVCWQDKGFNCGKCDKCLHFRMALELLNLQCGSLKPMADFRELKGAHVSTSGDYVEWKNNLELAETVGSKRAERALRKLLRPYQLRQILKQLDQVLFDGALNRYRKS
jgi:hypothetical protein